MKHFRFQRAGHSRKAKPETLSVLLGDHERPGMDEEGGSDMFDALLLKTSKPAMVWKILQIHL